MRRPTTLFRSLSLFTFTLSSLLALASAPASLVSAQTNQPSASGQGQNITVTPSSTQLSVDPGASVDGQFQVINSGSNALKITASASPYHVKGVRYDPQFTPLPDTVDASAWIKIQQTGSQDLAANKLLNYNYTVSVPAGTQPGGYYAVLFAESTPEQVPTQGVVARNRVGNILYLTVNGPVQKAGDASLVNLPLFSFKDSVSPAVLVRNTGGIHFRTQVDTKITNLFGKTVFSASLRRFVLPQTQRQIDATWDHTPPVGIYKVSRAATILDKKQQLADTWIVTVKPWVVVFLAIVILVALALFLSKKKRAGQTKTRPTAKRRR